MSWLGYAASNIAQTLLRFVPIPTKTGVIKIGSPDRDAPVFLTCNYHLTVSRVRRALRGMNCYLLAANTAGMNVWCASAGGHLTNHDVISVLKTSRIESMVGHRRVVLPQLAATGIEPGVIRQRAGWKVKWGPVRAIDIPAYVQNGFAKTEKMRQVTYSWPQRLESALSWSFPMSLLFVAIGAILGALVHRNVVLPLVGMVWILSLVLFVSFPLYGPWLAAGGRDATRWRTAGLQLTVWGAVLVGLVVYSSLTGFDPTLTVVVSISSLVIILALSLDIGGSTPVHKSGVLSTKNLTVVLDATKCRGTGVCEQVCPRGCFRIHREHRTAALPVTERCIRCGACIVQCPFDALHFEDTDGTVVPPDDIRRFKLNMMGKRLVRRI